jgi:hypothetical protein
MCSSIHQQIKPSILQLPHRISFLPLKETYKHVILKETMKRKKIIFKKKQKELKTNILKEQKRRIEFQNNETSVRKYNNFFC